MTRFSKLVRNEDGALVETDIRYIPQSAFSLCPHCIMVPEHYRADFTCRCDDKTHTEMKEWGYEWKEKDGKWR